MYIHISNLCILYALYIGSMIYLTILKFCVKHVALNFLNMAILLTSFKKVNNEFLMAN